MLESIPLGLCGITQGEPISDLLDRVHHARQRAEHQRAYDLFGSVLPYIAFALQDFEKFLQIEKRLMVRRGIFDSDRCRALTHTLSREVSEHVEFLLDMIVRLLGREGLSVP